MLRFNGKCLMLLTKTSIVKKVVCQCTFRLVPGFYTGADQYEDLAPTTASVLPPPVALSIIYQQCSGHIPLPLPTADANGQHRRPTQWQPTLPPLLSIAVAAVTGEAMMLLSQGSHGVRQVKIWEEIYLIYIWAWYNNITLHMAGGTKERPRGCGPRGCRGITHGD